MKNNSVIKTAENSTGGTSCAPGLRDRKREMMRLSILESASRLVAEGGSEALSLRKVAEDAGASTMVVYTVFGSKEGLLAALWREGFRRLWELEVDAMQSSDPMQTLRDLGSAYRKNALTNPAFYKLVFGGALSKSVIGVLEEEGDSECARTFEVLVDAVAACQQSKQLTKKLTANEIAAMFWSCAHGVVSLELSGMLSCWADPQQIFDRNLQALMDGLKENGK